MANVTVYNMEGNEVGTMELNDAVFGVEINEHLVHLAVVRQLANNRRFLTSSILFSTPSISSYRRYNLVSIS